MSGTDNDRELSVLHCFFLAETGIWRESDGGKKH